MPTVGDMQRLGIFKEMSYITIGDKFTSSSNRESNLGLQLFVLTFSRLAANSAILHPIKVRSMSRPIVAAKCRQA